MGRVEGKVAFITGVARGQGRSHAVRLAEEGADIIGIDAITPIESMPYPMGTREELDETTVLIEKAGGRAVLTQADVRDHEAVKDAVLSGVDVLGRLDIVCANAGISPPGASVWEIPPQQFRDVIDVNVIGVFNTLAATVPVLLDGGNGGSVIVTSSGAGLRSVQNLGDYNSSKQAVVGLAQTLANEVAKDGIRVNVIAPGTVRTPMVTANDVQFKVFRPDLTSPRLEDCIDVFKRIMPMGQPWVEPEDISNAVVFLASDEARYVTGIVMPVDQGSNNRVY